MKTRIAITAMMLLSANAVHAVPMLVNGGFETGDFTGWTQVTSNGTSNSCQTDWYVAIRDKECNTVDTLLSNPSEGTYAAYNSFDGTAQTSYTIEQDITLDSALINNASLGFSYTVGWDFSRGNTATLDRLFALSLYDVSDNLIGDAFTLSIGPDDGIKGTIDWTDSLIDITAFLTGYEGETVTLVADVFVPETFTGPGSFGLDAVNLDITTHAVSEPSTMALLGLSLLGLGLLKRPQSA